MSEQATGSLSDRVKGLVAHEARELMGALADRASTVLSERIGDVTERLGEVAAEGGSPRDLAVAVGAQKLVEGHSPLVAALGAGLTGGKEQVKQAFGKAGGGGRKGRNGLKVTNIVESIDVGVPVRVAYDQWTRFTDFPSFMKKVENVEQAADEKLAWKAQVFWSHRSWESTVVEQVPDERIVWRSVGQKGSVDGTVSFHELTEDLTRILVVLEYHPQGLFERTGNLWRAQGRRVRLELKHFVRHVMTRTVLNVDDLQGWRGEIRDGQVVRDGGYDVYDEEPDVQQPPEEPAAPVRRTRPTADHPEAQARPGPPVGRPAAEREPDRRRPARRVGEPGRRRPAPTEEKR